MRAVAILAVLLGACAEAPELPANITEVRIGLDPGRVLLYSEQDLLASAAEQGLAVRVVPNDPRPSAGTLREIDEAEQNNAAFTAYASSLDGQQRAAILLLERLGAAIETYPRDFGGWAAYPNTPLTHPTGFIVPDGAPDARLELTVRTIVLGRFRSTLVDGSFGKVVAGLAGHMVSPRFDIGFRLVDIESGAVLRSGRVSYVPRRRSRAPYSPTGSNTGIGVDGLAGLILLQLSSD